MTRHVCYDIFLQARQAMQEQLARNKELMQKLQVTSESEEEERGAEEEDDFVPDAVNEVQMTADGRNPWMVRNHSGDAKEAEIQKDPEKLLKPMASKASESEEEGPVEEEEILLKEFEERRLFREKSGLNQDTEPVGRQETKGNLWWTKREGCLERVLQTNRERKTAHPHMPHNDKALGAFKRVFWIPEKIIDCHNYCFSSKAFHKRSSAYGYTMCVLTYFLLLRA